MKPHKGNISILISTYDGAEDLWVPLEESYIKNWHDCECPIYLSTNHKVFEGKLFNSLAIGNEESWSDNIIKSLKKIPSEYVLLTFDDLFLNRSVDNSHFKSACEWGIKNNVNYLQMVKSISSKREYDNGFLVKVEGSEYRNGTVFSLWKKEFLLSVLNKSENAWQFETLGNERCATVPLFYSTAEECFSYLNGVVKGKWNPLIKNKLLKEGYEIDEKRGSFSSFELIKYQIVRFVFSVKRVIVK